MNIHHHDDPIKKYQTMGINHDPMNSKKLFNIRKFQFEMIKSYG